MEFEASKYMQYLEDGAFEQGLKYRAACVPDFLYKFVALSGNECDDKKRFYSLKNKMLWASPVNVQNDPYEFVGMYLDKKGLEKAGVPENVSSDIEEQNKTAFDIISLCDDALNNLPMWAHYANNHAGFCIEFKINNKRRIRNVIYEPKRIPLCNIFLNFLDAAKKFEKLPSKENQMNMERYSYVMQEMFFIKHESWRVEKEYRILCDHKNMSGYNISIDELGLELNCIYVGINCSQRNREELEAISAEIHIPIKYCQFSDTEFAVFKEG